MMIVSLLICTRSSGSRSEDLDIRFQALSTFFESCGIKQAMFKRLRGEVRASRQRAEWHGYLTQMRWRRVGMSARLGTSSTALRFPAGPGLLARASSGMRKGVPAADHGAVFEAVLVHCAIGSWAPLCRT
jgi:hypothetical protein